jgi:CheY-like chemotaxis protein
MIAKLLLWLDDDGPDRFMAECDTLHSAGFEVRWELDVQSAVRLLASEQVDALLLDQMLPLTPAERGKHTPVLAWSGCMLLHWLRGLPLPPAAPNEASAPFEQVTEGVAALAQNRVIPVQVVSAYYDVAVARAIEAAGSRMKRDRLVMAKPIDRYEFDDFISDLPSPV